MNLNATFIIQMLVFMGLAWFMANYVVPPMRKALDDRRQKVADGLAAAEQGKAAFAATNERIAQLQAQAKNDNATRLTEAEKQAVTIIEKAKADAEAERARILAQAKAEAAQEAVRARDQLRQSVAELAVQGAGQILQKEVDAAKHADLLAALKAKL